MNIKCTNCKKTIYLEKSTLEFIEKSKRNGREFIMLDCNNCGLGFSFNPQNKELPMSKPVWKCPISGCSGYVSYIDENETPYKDGKSFYGCGETGKMWYKKEDFYKDIEKTIQEYPYRRECYTYIDNEWIPNSCNIDDLIDEEEDKRWN